MTNELEITERTPLRVNHRSVEVESEMSENSRVPKPDMDDTKRIILKIVIDFVTMLLGEYFIVILHKRIFKSFGCWIIP